MDKYIEGVEIAKEAGLIVMCSNSKLNDPFAHYNPDRFGNEGIKGTNSRRLDELAGELVKSFAGKFKYLELGAGAGVAAATMAEKFGAEVHTVGLTPINPFLRFPEYELKLGINSSLSTDYVAVLKAMYKKSDEVITCIRRGVLPPQVLLEVQKEYGNFFFVENPEPFIKKQFIGRFPEEIPLRGNSYDFIFDECGPCMYSTFDKEINARIISGLLSERGIFHTPIHHYCAVNFPSGARISDGRDVVLVKRQNPLFEIVGGENREVKNMSSFIRDCIAQTFS